MNKIPLDVLKAHHASLLGMFPTSLQKRFIAIRFSFVRQFGEKNWDRVIKISIGLMATVLAVSLIHYTGNMVLAPLYASGDEIGQRIVDLGVDVQAQQVTLAEAQSMSQAVGEAFSEVRSKAGNMTAFFESDKTTLPLDVDNLSFIGSIINKYEQALKLAYDEKRVSVISPAELTMPYRRILNDLIDAKNSNTLASHAVFKENFRQLQEAIRTGAYKWTEISGGIRADTVAYLQKNMSLLDAHLAKLGIGLTDISKKADELRLTQGRHVDLVKKFVTDTPLTLALMSKLGTAWGYTLAEAKVIFYSNQQFHVIARLETQVRALGGFAGQIYETGQMTWDLSIVGSVLSILASAATVLSASALFISQGIRMVRRLRQSWFGTTQGREDLEFMTEDDSERPNTFDWLKSAVDYVQIPLTVASTGFFTGSACLELFKSLGRILGMLLPISVAWAIGIGIGAAAVLTYVMFRTVTPLLWSLYYAGSLVAANAWWLAPILSLSIGLADIVVGARGEQVPSEAPGDFPDPAGGEKPFNIIKSEDGSMFSLSSAVNESLKANITAIQEDLKRTGEKISLETLFDPASNLFQ